jgi:hypothetical protein
MNTSKHAAWKALSNVADKVIEKAAKRVRDSTHDFQLEHSIHPTAIIAGKKFQNLIINSLNTYQSSGDDQETAMRRCHLTACQTSGQITFLGFPIIDDNRERDAFTMILMDTSFLRP